MKYSAILLSAIAASGAMAAPQGTSSSGGRCPAPESPAGSGVIKLDNPAVDKQVEHSVTNVDNLSKFSFGGFNGEPTFTEVKLTLDSNIRCKANDKDGNPFAVKRQPNTDFTFAKGEKWTFAKEAAVAEVICDAAFEQLSPEDQAKIVVEFRVKKDSPDAVSIPIAFEALEADVPENVDTKDIPFEYVTLRLGPKAVAEDEALRCQILTGTPEQQINVSRGENVNKPTFADGFKGAWKFTAGPSIVSNMKIVCGKKIQEAGPGAGATPEEGSTMPPASGTVPPVVGGSKPQGNDPQSNDPQGNNPQGYKGYEN